LVRIHFIVIALTFCYTKKYKNYNGSEIKTLAKLLGYYRLNLVNKLAIKLYKNHVLSIHRDNKNIRDSSLFII